MPRNADLQFDDQIQAYIDGQMSIEDSATLERRLLDEPNAMRRYARLFQLHAELAWRHRASASVSTETETFLRIAPTDERSRRERPNIGGRSKHSMTALAAGLAAAVITAVASVAIYVFAFVPQSDVPNPKSTARVATLIDATDGTTVMVDSDIAHPGSDYHAGTYRIDSGEADFLLSNRVGVRISGETTLTMHSNMSASLNRGLAMFDCPPSAKGYTVHLPFGARVVDLGTRFGVDVRDGDRARVWVNEGAVRVIPDSASEAWTEPILLAAGDRLTLTRSARQAPEVSVRRFDRKPGDRVLLVEDFDDQSPETVFKPGGWTLHAKADPDDVRISDDHAVSSPNALRMVDHSQTGKPGISRSWEAVSGRVRVEFAYREQCPDGGSPDLLRLLIASDDRSLHCVRLIIRNGQLCYGNAPGEKPIVPVSADRWYAISVLADTSAQSFDLSVDGVTVLRDAPFLSPAHAIGRMQIIGIEKAVGELWLDDIAVLVPGPIQSAEPVDPAAPAIDPGFPAPSTQNPPRPPVPGD